MTVLHVAEAMQVRTLVYANRCIQHINNGFYHTKFNVKRSSEKDQSTYLYLTLHRPDESLSSEVADDLEKRSLKILRNFISFQELTFFQQWGMYVFEASVRIKRLASLFPSAVYPGAGYLPDAITTKG